MKSLLILAITTIGFSAQAGLFDFSKMSVNHSNSEQTLKVSCADFTGIWKGTCTSSDNSGNKDTYSSDMVVNQESCEVLFFDEEKYYANGTKKEELIGVPGSDRSVINLSRSSENIINLSGTYQSQNISEGYEVKSEMNGSLMLVNGKFVSVVNMRGTFKSGNKTSRFSNKSECTYDK